MNTKDKFKNSYNSFRKEYRILETEKSNGITNVLFFDRVGATAIARQNVMDAPLHTFELYPYKPYWIYKIYWLFLNSFIKKRKTINKPPNPNPIKKHPMLSKLIEYWWILVVTIIAGIILFMIERGTIDIGL